MKKVSGWIELRVEGVGESKFKLDEGEIINLTIIY